MLLYMKEQVATFTGRIEVRARAQGLQLNACVPEGPILAEPTNAIGGTRVPACGNQFTHFDHMPACRLAVEAQVHESSGPQARQQDSPSVEGVGQMMQDSD